VLRKRNGSSKGWNSVVNFHHSWCSLPAMDIGAKLRELRVAKNLSQGDIEKRTGLIRCYTSRVENGYTVPSIGTLEKYAHALEVPLYRFFTDEASVKMPKLPKSESDSSSWGARGKERSAFRALAKALARMDEPDQKLLLSMAHGMARRGGKH
jgi:transcriptional regulator with XRE-family HTH domain